VIVVNWNVRDLLRECLRSVCETLRPVEWGWELIVVDNHSSDGSAEMVRDEFPQATLLQNGENLGFAKANNQAFRRCRGELILLLNPDTVVPEHALDRMAGIMKARADAGALGCRLVGPDGSVQRFTGGHPPGILNVSAYYLLAQRALPPRLLPSPLFLAREPESDEAVGWVSGCCMLLRRQALGGAIFDERFFLYGEDLELCQRLARSGWMVLYTPRVQITHHGGRSLEAQTADLRLCNFSGLRQAFVLGNGRAWLFDIVMSVAFLLRCAAFGAAACARPGRGFGIRAARSRDLLSAALRMLLHRKACP
jgi:hypothetical protein